MEPKLCCRLWTSVFITSHHHDVFAPRSPSEHTLQDLGTGISGVDDGGIPWSCPEGITTAVSDTFSAEISAQDLLCGVVICGDVVVEPVPIISHHDPLSPTGRTAI